MLCVVTLVSALLAVLTWIAQYAPGTLAYALILSCSIGAAGFGIVLLATAMLLSVYVTGDTPERDLNTAKCLNLALIGMLMVALPILNVILIFVMLPMIRFG